MTKKSAAREARDEAQRHANDPNSFQNSFWHKLEDMYQALLAGLNNAVRQIEILYLTEGLIPYLSATGNKELPIAIRGLAQDHGNLKRSLDAIYAKHKDKDHTNVSEEQVVFAAQLAGEYEEWRSDFIGAVMPNVEYLIAEINLVLNRVRASTAANGLAIAKDVVASKQEEATTPA